METAAAEKRYAHLMMGYEVVKVVAGDGLEILSTYNIIRAAK